MLEIAYKNLKATATDMFKDLNIMMTVMIEQIRNSKREMKQKINEKKKYLGLIDLSKMIN